MEFLPFEKISRLSRHCTITEKIDGTNACIGIAEDGGFFIGSRNRWLTGDDDHFGFHIWALKHKEELLQLGPGRHYGEWWGIGIQRRYSTGEKRFSLFNSARWTATRPPACCHVVPVLYSGVFTSTAADDAIAKLEVEGSAASPGFMQPEGIVIYQSAARMYFKKTIKNDDSPKSQE